MLGVVSSPELSVVCKSCGSEVSPYVTECPYCGSRLRKRAPKLQREGDELTAKPPRRARARARRQRRSELLSFAGSRPYATIAAILGPAILLLVQRALDRPLFEFGAIAGPLNSDWWHYLAAPWVYTDIGYLFVVGVAVALFGSALEERLGTPAVLVLMIACGALGMLAADGIENAIRGDTEITLAAGGNGVALGLLTTWYLIRRADVKRYPVDEIDVIGVAVVAVVLLALPVVDDWANVWAGLGGAAVGAVAGFTASLAAGKAEA
jgi:membrane associated rhomboid family serine protease